MAQPIQIVPKYKFPNVETVINDYTVVNDNGSDGVSSEPAVRYFFPFVSAKGIDNRFILKNTRKGIVDAYGDSNFKKFGQPLMQALNVADIPNTEVWCMRVMPENAAYSNNCISLYYKADDAAEVQEASKRKFRIKFVQKILMNPDGTGYKTKQELFDAAKKLDGAAVTGVYTDGEGYVQVPGAILLYCAGRGKYGDTYRLRMTQDIVYEKDYGIKFYDFEILNSSSGLKRDTTYIGCAVTSPKYSSTTLINDILEDQDDGVVPMYIRIDEDGIEDVYNAFCSWASALIKDLNDEMEEKLAEYAIPDGMIENEIPVTAEYADKVAEILDIKEKIEYASNLPSLDEFDVIFGRRVATTTVNPFLQYPAKLTDDIDTSAEDYNPAEYTLSDVVFFDTATGIRMSGGDDGYFGDPRVETSLDDDGNEISIKWTRDQEIEDCYKKAFSGVYDARILTCKRIPANAIWDANYPMSVKQVMADLAVMRKDGICYLDAGIRSSFGTSELNQMISDFSVFSDIEISKNVQHYTVREPSTNKRVVVTISYLLSALYAYHVLNNGVYVPFVKENCQLTGHIKDSLQPTVEDYEQDLKEILNENRFNYFETVGMDNYQRATQNTAVSYNSDLLEESNVATMFDAKRIIENDITARLYDFTDATIRNDFREYELSKFTNWIGSRCERMDINFGMNAWEERRSILHCWLSMTFRGIQKRGILEIDINPRNISDTPMATTSTN